MGWYTSLRVAQVDGPVETENAEPFQQDFTIWEARYSELEQLVAGLQKLATRLGVQPPLLEVTGEEVVQKKRRNVFGVEEVVPVRYLKVHVEGEVPKLPGGWELLGVIDHVSSDGNVVRPAPGKTVPEEFYTSEQRCDMCGAKRQRIATYVVQDETGGIKCVGSDCVKKFLGWYKDPLLVAKYLEQIADFVPQFSGGGDGDYDEDFEGGGGGGRGIGTLEYLAHVAALVRTGGFVSKSAAAQTDGMSTSDAAVQNYYEKNKEHRIPVEQEDYDTAQATLQWLQGLDRSWVGGDDYRNNIFALRNVHQPSQKHLGLIASMIPLYKREMARQTAAEQAEKQKAQQVAENEAAGITPHLGEVGQRLPMTLLVERVIPREGDFGMTYITKMKDANGRVVTWFGSQPLDEGATYNMVATIKKLEEYQGVPQTIIQRPGKIQQVESFEAGQATLPGAPKPKSTTPATPNVKVRNINALTKILGTDARPAIKQVLDAGGDLQQAAEAGYPAYLAYLLANVPDGYHSSRQDDTARHALQQLGITIPAEAGREGVDPEAWADLRASQLATAIAGSYGSSSDGGIREEARAAILSGQPIGEVARRLRDRHSQFVRDINYTLPGKEPQGDGREEMVDRLGLGIGPFEAGEVSPEASSVHRIVSILKSAFPNNYSYFNPVELSHRLARGEDLGTIAKELFDEALNYAMRTGDFSADAVWRAAIELSEMGVEVDVPEDIEDLETMGRGVRQFGEGSMKGVREEIARMRERGETPDQAMARRLDREIGGETRLNYRHSEYLRKLREQGFDIPEPEFGEDRQTAIRLLHMFRKQGGARDVFSLGDVRRMLGEMSPDEVAQRLIDAEAAAPEEYPGANRYLESDLTQAARSLSNMGYNVTVPRVATTPETTASSIRGMHRMATRLDREGHVEVADRIDAIILRCAR